MSSAWTSERVETLTRLWTAGESARQIARHLGNSVTRNAVIGKIHRLGLSGRPVSRGAARSGCVPKRKEPRLRRSSPPATPRYTAAARGPTEPPQPGLATVLSVRRGQCRWPIGDPLADAFRLCGRRAERGAYCAVHGAAAYRRAADAAG